MRGLNIAALVLIIIGAVNWGLVGLFRFNLVAAIFGENSVLTNLIYVLVAIAGLYALSFFAQYRFAPRHHTPAHV